MCIGLQQATWKVVAPRITIRFYTVWIILKHHQRIFILLIPQADVIIKIRVALVEPVVKAIRDNFPPALLFGNAADASEFGNGFQLLFAGQVVADVVEVNLSPFFGLRVFDKYGNSNRRTAAWAENFAALFARTFAWCALVAAQVEDIQAGKFLCQTFAQSVCGIGFYPTCIGYEADNALLSDAVGCPADGADVAVV